MPVEFNPYRSPEAPGLALPPAPSRPPVYSAISLLGSAVGAFHLVGTGLLVFSLARTFRDLGWRGGLGNDRTPTTLLLIALGLAATFCYLGSARWLRLDRGRPGLIACVAGFGLTFLLLQVLNH